MNALKDFLNEVIKCVENDDTNGWFDDRCGLCSNLERWCMFYGMNRERYHFISEQMSDVFVSEFGNFSYPFGGCNLYYAEQYNGIMYDENGMRMEWIRDFVSR